MSPQCVETRNEEVERCFIACTCSAGVRPLFEPPKPGGEREFFEYENLCSENGEPIEQREH